MFQRVQTVASLDDSTELKALAFHFRICLRYLTDFRLELRHGIFTTRCNATQSQILFFFFAISCQTAAQPIHQPRTSPRDLRPTSRLFNMCKGYRATYNCGCSKPTKSYYRCRDRKGHTVCPAIDPSDDIVLTVYLCLGCMQKRDWRLDPEKDCD